ncbi:MAG: glutamate synthase-related protein, partial [Planctomycetota bacterium]
MARAGIFTLSSYKGSRRFEIIGLSEDLVQMCFTNTPSRIQGASLAHILEDALRRHTCAFHSAGVQDESLPNIGLLHWRANGEKHAWDPHAISFLQLASRTNSLDAYRRYTSEINDATTGPTCLRDIIGIREHGDFRPVPVEEVEPASQIVKRFVAGGSSLGGISAEAHDSIAIALNRLGGRSSSGDGGEDSNRALFLPNGDSRRSSTKVVGAGRFGVTAWYLTNADEIQIRIAHGAAPGEGAGIPSSKVDQYISRLHMSTLNEEIRSPPAQPDVNSIDELGQLVYDLKCANPHARISIQLAAQVGVGLISVAAAKAGAEHILISGGASSAEFSTITSIRHAGVPWELGLAESHQSLVLSGLRSRTVLSVEGGIKTGRDVAIAIAFGAEEVQFNTAPLIALGCIMMRKCHLNTCPVGVATQDPELRRRFAGRPEHIVNYLFMVAEEVREIAAALGFRHVTELIGRADILESRIDGLSHRIRDIDLSPMLIVAPRRRADQDVYCTMAQDHHLETSLDNTLVHLCEAALKSDQPVKVDLAVTVADRSVGTMLSHEVMKRYGEEGLPDDSIMIRLHGTAGSSFGSYLVNGITLELEGEANDSVGKGLSGGRVVISPHKGSKYVPEEN